MPPGEFPQQVLTATPVWLKLPGRGSHSQPRALIETGNVPDCLSGIFIYLCQTLPALTFQRGLRYNCLLKQNPSLSVGIPRSIYPFS